MYLIKDSFFWSKILYCFLKRKYHKDTYDENIKCVENKNRFLFYPIQNIILNLISRIPNDMHLDNTICLDNLNATFLQLSMDKICDKWDNPILKIRK